MQVNVATSGRWSPTVVDVGVPPGIAKERGVRLGRPPKLNAINGRRLWHGARRAKP